MTSYIAATDPSLRATHEDIRPGESPLPPDRDPFYQPPQGFETAAPGTVFRSRSIELGFLGVMPQGFTATQLLYRSSDLHGAPEVAVTTVLVPEQRDPDIGCPLVSYQCAIDAISPRCFPSYALRHRARPVGAFVQSEFLFIAAALAEGWAVSVPDHEGCHGMWGSPREPGYRILDGVRAALGCERLGLAATTAIGLWGYSGGGLASAWAVEQSADYAPELNIAGAVLGSPVADPGSVARRLNRSFFAGLAALMIAALTDVLPGARRIVDEHATRDGKALLDELHTMTTVGAVWRLRHVDIGDYVDLTAEELWDLPAAREVFDETRLGQSVPKPPVLVVQAVHDRIISVEDVDHLVDTYRAGGAAVTYHRDPCCGHLLLHPVSAPMTLRWLRDRFTGRALDAHPTRSRWPVLLHPATYVGMVKLGVITGKVMLGRPVERKPLS
ncbi:lipase family protein [Mycolicibacterium thermoresistibile]